jgi:DNA-binding transcriptional LysR family regulator
MPAFGYFDFPQGPRHPLHAVYPANRRLSARLRIFVDWIAGVFAPFDDRKA